MCLVQCNHMKINGSWVEGKSKMDCAAWCSNCQVDREGGGVYFNKPSTQYFGHVNL